MGAVRRARSSGLILTGAALHGASVETSLLLLAYAAGAATSLALALARRRARVRGDEALARRRRMDPARARRRRAGVGALAIALGLDTGLLARLSTASTAALEQSLVDRLHPEAITGLDCP